MKKSLHLLAVIMITVLASCTTEKIDNENSYRVEERVLEVTKETNLDTQKLKYELLDSSEKLALWQRKFEAILITEELNKSQRQLIQELQLRLNREVFMFDHYNEYKEEFFSSYKDDFINRALLEFENEQIFYFFYSISNKLPDEGGGTGVNCTCNVDSPTSCILGTYECKEKQTCRQKVNGCGWLWADTCDGNCF